MRLYTFVVEDTERFGAEVAGHLIDLAAAERAQGGKLAAIVSDIHTFIEAGAAAMHVAHAALAFAAAHPQAEGARYPLGAVQLRAPIQRPGKMLCSGVNYLGHLTENPGATLPETPGCFSKLNNTIIGPGAAIVHPRVTEQLDYEIELAVVLGKRLRRANEDEATAAVFGYTILHDVSARDIQFKPPMHNQITLGKNFDTFCPIGPCIVTADEIANPANLRLRTWLNDQLVQDASTNEWVFSLPQMLAFFSQIMTLEPGDIVTTGTPAGVGVFRKPPLYMHPGDVVRLEIEGIGVLENPVVAEEE